MEIALRCSTTHYKYHHRMGKGIRSSLQKLMVSCTVLLSAVSMRETSTLLFCQGRDLNDRCYRVGMENLPLIIK